MPYAVLERKIKTYVTQVGEIDELRPIENVTGMMRCISVICLVRKKD